MNPILTKINLEEYGQGGYMMYRIPGVVVTPKGTVLLYYEARMGTGDWTKQDVLLRRSEDGGETWSDRSLLVAGTPAETLHNANMFVDVMRDCLHFVWHRDYRQAFYQRSVNDGVTWSKPVEITYVFERFRSDYDWNVIATGPGHGIVLKNGRLFAPVWLSNGGAVHRPSIVSSIYSDDGGETWERGEIIWESDWLKMPNETTAVQLATGEVLMNMRHEADDHYRAITVSPDGVSGWSEPRLDKRLPDPICFGSLIRYAEESFQGFNGILFSNCAFDGGDKMQKREWMKGHLPFWAGLDTRVDLTVRYSSDECETWAFSKLLEPFAGYSDLAVSLDCSRIYCLYERDWVNGISTNTKYMTIAVFNLEWVKSI